MMHTGLRVTRRLAVLLSGNTGGWVLACIPPVFAGEGRPALAYRAKQKCRSGRAQLKSVGAPQCLPLSRIAGFYCGSVMRRSRRLAAALASARRFEEAGAGARSPPATLAATVKSGE